MAKTFTNDEKRLLSAIAELHMTLMLRENQTSVLLEDIKSCKELLRKVGYRQ